ncbi:D-lactate dehydrogenase (cytochrome) [Pseudodesulfovibrio mercurii]|uniref:D-lactate dehydrogenase (cytochrome) n=1 Tax=Pseudodesulfovibrio mercurii TaxID=641491 RepID=F0JIB9_9BACT|nr:FAD-binding and (Fe-S)-binding domain-containing protein [Pseudodesulfovibrio mercurii]EGB14171.1 D-lactate dehydrogenase (cytochrome) [Pseudodesulfovibrio mercurii]
MPSQKFIDAVSDSFPKDQVYLDEVIVHALSLDASPFEPRAKMLVDVRSEEELQDLLSLAREHGAGLTFRGACSGINGQTVGEDVMVRFRGPAWTGIRVLDNGDSIWAQNMVPGQALNGALVPFGRIIGPDPGSISVATLGGMAANNSTGMCCTIEQSIFHTMRSMRVLLADGTILDTSDEHSRTAFRKAHEELLSGLADIRARILADDELKGKIKRKYSIRNTSGYSMNAFTEFEDPMDILVHLMIGSEGTLGCILDVCLKTVVLEPCRATSFMLFPSLENAIQAISVLSREKGLARAAELMDRVTLKAVESFPSTSDIVHTLDDKACAVLLETQARDEATLKQRTDTILELLKDIPCLTEHEFVTDPKDYARLWDMRRNTYPAFAGFGGPSEFTVTEDWCVPPERLGEAAETLQNLLEKHGFQGGIMGHAFHGNMHFILSLPLAEQAAVDNLKGLTEDIVDVMIEHFEGSLKAEHGTGRSIAPYVAREWGPEIYGMMQKLKRLLDPQGLFNPGVLLNDDPDCNFTGLKQPWGLHEFVDNCNGCGFCDSVCPTREIGFTPRQRIYVKRTIERLRKQGDTKRAEHWEEMFRQYGLDICATDGLCQLRCPLAVDTASYMRHLRHENLSDFAKGTAHRIGRNFSKAAGLASMALTVGRGSQEIIGHGGVALVDRLARKAVGMCVPDLPAMKLRGGSSVPSAKANASRQKVVYFPSCAVRTMGYDKDGGPGQVPLMDTTVTLLYRAGYEVIFPEGMKNLCCGKAYETKGMSEEADRKSDELGESLLKATENGRWPVLCDTSPCLARMKKHLDKRLALFEPIEFAKKFLVDRLDFVQLSKTVAVHPTCSTRTMGLTDSMVDVASLCAEHVVLPEGINCCGFAGDKGFTHPEVNASALAELPAQVAACREGYSTSRTCESGLTLHSGKPYFNLLYLLEESSRGA